LAPTEALIDSMTIPVVRGLKLYARAKRNMPILKN
jgi:hypothetical protein